MTEIALYMNELGVTLRSGGAKGADDAFEKGAGENKEIYLHRRESNGRISNGSSIIDASKLPGWKDCILDALRVHPSPSNLNGYALELHARNVNQVLGRDRSTPSTFLICYSVQIGDNLYGGTATAIRIAQEHKVPVINLFNNEKCEEEIMSELSLIVMAASR